MSEPASAVVSRAPFDAWPAVVWSLLTWPALAAAQEAAPDPVATDAGSQLPMLIIWVAVGAVVSTLCFGAAIAWARARPARSGSYNMVLAGAAIASVVITEVAAMLAIGGLPTFWLQSLIAYCVVVAVALSRWLHGRERQPSPGPESVANVEPGEVPPEPARRAHMPPASPAARTPQAESKPVPDGSGAAPGSVFISYRRTDSSDVTGRIYDRLVASHGKTHVFKDVDSIPLGTDFRRHVADLIEESDCVLAVIGRQWLDVADSAGRRRLDDPTDLVRIEIEAALARGVPVIPLLVQGASMPEPHALPEALRPLAFRNGMAVRAAPDFHRDLDRLDEQLRLLHGTGAR